MAGRCGRRKRREGVQTKHKLTKINKTDKGEVKEVRKPSGGVDVTAGAGNIHLVKEVGVGRWQKSCRRNGRRDIQTRPAETKKRK